MKVYLAKLFLLCSAVFLALAGLAVATAPPYPDDWSDGWSRYPTPEYHWATIMVSGNLSGTAFIDIDLNDSFMGPQFLQRESVDGSRSSQGGYLAPDGRLFAGSYGGNGLQIFQKSGGGWRLKKSVSDGRARSVSAVDLKDSSQNPTTGLLSVNDPASGSEFFFDLNKETWVAAAGLGGWESFRGSGVIDTAYGADGTAWSTGYGGFYRSTPGALSFPEKPLLRSLRQNQIFTVDGTEYLAVADGSSGDLRFFYTENGCREAGRIHVTDGEVLGVAVYDNRWIVVSDRSDGDLIFLKVGPSEYCSEFDGRRTCTVTLGPNVSIIGDIPGELVNGGRADDIAGVGFVEVDGAWVRN